MPFYHKLGELPKVKHTRFLKPDGKSLYREELVSSKGFSGVYSNKYHIHMPTALLRSRELKLHKNVDWPEAEVLHCHFFTDDLKSKGNFITGRNIFLQNGDCTLGTCRVTEETDNFFRNAYHNEYIFVHHGSGTLRSEFGDLPFEPGDQIIIPRTVIYHLAFDDYSADNKLMIVESRGAFEIPSHYHNAYGQLEERAPYAERDFKIPKSLQPRDEKGEFCVILKANNRYFEHIVPHHPFDVVGWDGYFYPFAFNIKDYHSKVGRIHLPPPTHLAFITKHFVLCNFTPRPFDFHDEAIPTPYWHSNIDSDEVLYYVEGDFMSRKGVREGSITLHPGGMPHGPQPGRTEASIGAPGTNEYAVMVDTFVPLRPTKNAQLTLDEKYPQSWLE